jgi:hypothetical protein
MIITSNKSTDTGRVLFDQLAEAYIERPGVGLGRMMSSQGLTINKKIFAMSVRGRLVVKVPAKQVRAWTADGRGEPFEPRPGRLMREWLSVPYEPGARGRRRWRSLIDDAFEFVSTQNKQTT